MLLDFSSNNMSTNFECAEEGEREREKARDKEEKNEKER